MILRKVILVPALLAILCAPFGSVQAQYTVTESSPQLGAASDASAVSEGSSLDPWESFVGDDSVITTSVPSAAIGTNGDTLALLTLCEGPECAAILTKADLCGDKATLAKRIATVEKALEDINKKLDEQLDRIVKNDGFDKPELVDEAILLGARIARLKKDLEKSKADLQHFQDAEELAPGVFSQEIQAQKNNIAIFGNDLAKAEKELADLKTPNKDAKIKAGQEQMAKEMAKMKELTEMWNTLTLQLQALKKCLA